MLGKSWKTTLGGAGTGIGLILVLLGLQFGGGELPAESGEMIEAAKGGGLGLTELVGLIVATVSSLWSGIHSRDDNVTSEGGNTRR